MDISNNPIHIWRPFDAFDSYKYLNMALIILNQPITVENELKLKSLWQSSDLKFCVDGGANQLYNWALRSKKEENYIPDYICGDLDSLDESIRSFYVNKGTKCVHLLNQDLNDFTKTLRFAVNCFLNKNLKSDLISNTNTSPSSVGFSKIQKIYCFCDSSGRLDHTLGNLSTLYDECLESIETYLIGTESLTFLLKKGFNMINIENELFCGKYCGLFPLGEPAIVTTAGLKWNLNKKILKFGSFVSSSNEICSSDIRIKLEETRKKFSSMQSYIDINKNQILIETSQRLLFTMSVKQ